MEPSALIIARPDDFGPFFSAFLEKLLGFRTRVAASFDGLKDVLGVLSEDRFDLLLVTDNTLVLESIREVVSGVRCAYPGMAIIVVSGAAQPEFITDLVQRGANEVIPMPFEAEQLIDAVKRYCHIG